MATVLDKSYVILRVILVGKDTMPKGKPKRRARKSLIETIENDLSSHLKLGKLSTDSINLLNLLTLVVDIEYRREYGGSIDWREGRGYSKQSKDDLADQLPPIDDAGSARLTSMGDN